MEEDSQDTKRRGRTREEKGQSFCHRSFKGEAEEEEGSVLQQVVVRIGAIYLSFHLEPEVITRLEQLKPRTTLSPECLAACSALSVWGFESITVTFI